jgi:hypothetical protein
MTMTPFTLPEAQLRASFINASQRERAAIVPPAADALARLDWTAIDYLGWRDRKQPQLGYVIADVNGEPVGLMLRQAEAKTRSRPQCSWCDDVTLPNDVVFFGAKRAGRAGRNGDTVGALVCDGFQCSANVRRLPPLAYTGFDRDAARQQRIKSLRMHVRAFALAVRDGA